MSKRGSNWPETTALRGDRHFDRAFRRLALRERRTGNQRHGGSNKY